MHIATRPPRRGVQAVIVASVFLGCLGLAWWQVRGTRVLGAPVRLERTPVLIRPPKGWVAAPDRPGVFLRPVHRRLRGRDMVAPDRRLEVRYNDYFTQLVRLFQAASSAEPRPAQIAGWPAVEFLTIERQRPWVQQSIYRWASLPWGGQLSVEYTPLGEATGGDIELLDAICRSIEITGEDLYTPRDETLAFAGVDFEAGEDWQVLGPQLLRGPGLCIQQKPGDDGVPDWGLAVFRRGLSARGGPRALLIGEAVETLGRFVPPVELRRVDGAYVAFARNPEAIRARNPIVSIWVVADSRRHVAVIYALADPQHAKQADQAAERLARSLRFESAYPR